MTARIALLLALAVALVAVPVLAQRAPSAAVEQYRQAAAQYIAGEMESAESAARAGLRIAPDDAKLKALLDLITKDKEEEDGDQNQDSDGQSGDDGEQESGDASDSSDGSQDGESDDAQDGPEDDTEAKRDGTNRDQDAAGENDEAPQNPGAQRPGEGDATPAGESAAQAGQMSRAQAERLLDAVGGDEQLLMREMRRMQSRAGSDKDW